MPGRHDDDAELIKKAQQGDAYAFGQLYERYAAAVFRYNYSHLDNRMDAEDLTGDVFLKAWRSLPRYDERGVPFLAFLFRIAHNVLVDFYRKVSQTRQDSSDLTELRLADPNPSPLETASTRVEHEELLLVMSELRLDYQTVLILRFLSDLSAGETAEVMGRTEGAIRVLQHRALTALRDLLMKDKRQGFNWINDNSPASNP